MTPYETAVNEASAKLALEDPSLVIKRDVLYEKAKEVLGMIPVLLSKRVSQDQPCLETRSREISKEKVYKRY